MRFTKSTERSVRILALIHCLRRFAEQSYLLLYYLVYWPLGVYLFVEDTPSSVDSMNSLLISLWRDFPRLYIAAPMKLYYLSQFAFWIQQLAVIHLEERRKVCRISTTEYLASWEWQQTCSPSSQCTSMYCQKLN